MLVCFTGLQTKAFLKDDSTWVTYNKLIGKKDPQSELNSSVLMFKEELKASDTHPQCLYPGRYLILKNKYQLASPVNCPKFQLWQKEYGLKYISIFYAAQYLSNPASVFGHTFFLLGSEKTNTFTQITFNYAAEISPDENAFNYAYKGLTGKFKGSFSLIPLYHRLHVYNDMENRDLWEYKLNLNSEELEFLASLLWELNEKVSLDYYFLDENCASLLLWIIKIVRPGIDVSVTHPLFFAPSEVPKILAREKLISEIKYHPSLRQRLNWKYSLMNDFQKNQYRLAKNQVTPIENIKDSLILEIILDEVAIEKSKMGEQIPNKVKNIERSALIQRSQLSYDLPILTPQAAKPEEPHFAQDPMQIHMGWLRTQNRSALNLKLRPAIHGILDREAGYIRNSAIEVFEIETSHSLETLITLEKINFFTLTNYRPLEFNEFPLSWSFDILLMRNRFFETGNRYQAQTGFKAGWARELGSSQFTGYLMLGGDLMAGQIKPLGHLNIGPVLGLLISKGLFKSKTEVSSRTHTNGNTIPELLQFSHEFRYELNFKWSLFLSYFKYQSPGKTVDYDEIKFSFARDF